MNSLAQIGAVALLAIKGLPRRKGTSTVVVMGMAGAVAVLVSVLGMASSLERASVGVGRADRALVMRAASSAEVRSSLSRSAVASIEHAVGVRRDAAGMPMTSAEALVLLPARLKDNGKPSSVTLRGAGGQLLAVRPELRIVEGRMFAVGLNEAIVGRTASAEFAGLKVGDRVRERFSTGEWTIVGRFESGGSALESELLTDATTLMSAYQRDQYQSVTVVLENAGALADFAKSLNSQPGLSLAVERETEFLATRSKPLVSALSFVAWVVGAIMGVGALLTAINSMYTVVSQRSREFGTLGALGFNPESLLVSVLVEALVLACVGAALGGLLAWALFDGSSIATLGMGNPTPLIYRVSISPEIFLVAAGLACALGLSGALLPAIRAARLAPAVALRED